MAAYSTVPLRSTVECQSHSRRSTSAVWPYNHSGKRDYLGVSVGVKRVGYTFACILIGPPRTAKALKLPVNLAALTNEALGSYRLLDYVPACIQYTRVCVCVCEAC